MWLLLYLPPCFVAFTVTKMEIRNTKIALARTDFNVSCTKIFSSLLDNPDFSDVTLACEDGALVHGHKFLLSAASPYFRNLLSSLKVSKSKILQNWFWCGSLQAWQHPVLVLRDISHIDVTAILGNLNSTDCFNYWNLILQNLYMMEKLMWAKTDYSHSSGKLCIEQFYHKYVSV